MKAWNASFWYAPSPKTPRPRTLSRSSSTPMSAPAPSANTTTKPVRVRSKTSHASAVMAQKRMPPMVGVPILTMCERGLYDCTRWPAPRLASCVVSHGYSTTPDAERQHAHDDGVPHGVIRHWSMATWATCFQTGAASVAPKRTTPVSCG